jgi:hypothetical protein
MKSLFIDCLMAMGVIIISLTLMAVGAFLISCEFATKSFAKATA